MGWLELEELADLDTEADLGQALAAPDATPIVPRMRRALEANATAEKRR